MSEKIHNILVSNYKRNKTVTKILDVNGCIKLRKKRRGDFFLHLSKTVVGQQLSTSAANTIWGRVLDTAKKRDCEVIDLFHARKHATLRKCGLSRSKIKAICGLREAVENKAIAEEIFTTKDQELVISEISKLWGFGRWSGEMAAMFFFGLPDVWSDLDLALTRGAAIISEREKIPVQKVIDTASPYKSYFALHVWQAIGKKIL